MHETEDGISINPDGSAQLLRDDSPSDLCLSCHAYSNGAVFSQNVLLPLAEYGGGSFVFLLEDNINDKSNGTAYPIAGNHAGHNIVAPGYGLSSDPDKLTAPGGSFPSGNLSCTSCHDPHGNGNFRMLYGVGQIQGGLYTFTRPAPQAVGINLSGAPESKNNHTAYKSGMSEWCSNCHGLYHDQVGRTNLEHPVGEQLDQEERNRYNAYNGTNDPTGSSVSIAFIAEVPFEDLSMTNFSTSGPTSSSKIMCLTCHRAHASSGPASGRWDFYVLYLDQDGSISGSYPIPSPYPGPNEQQLCLKCHHRIPH